ncbi:MAG: YicC/YloC family endoribonuclease [Rikenellaceae bacterium]
MVKSMTGFGRSEVAMSDRVVAIELRSVNSKQLDLSLRAPSIYRALEAEIRAIITKGVQRGKCELSINVNSSETETSASINRDVFVEYCRQLSEALRAAGIDEPLTQSSAVAVMRMPDVVSTRSEGISDGDKALLMGGVESAVEMFNLFREQEGATMIADLLERVNIIESKLEEIGQFDQLRIETIRQRIRDHIERERIDVDKNRFEAEMIYYVEKLDITEEKVRLRNHCNYFREVVAEEQSVGRKLGFIAQEMGREINTLGSKSNDSAMQRIVVQMKDELEKIKEQVLNIL